jgi:NADH-quinone oxidoreductase subunit A
MCPAARAVVEPNSVEQYLPIVLLMVLGILFAAGSFMASGLLSPRKRPTSAKLAPYECGIVPDRDPPQRFPVRFYLVAMIFIIFDIEIIFLFPFAVIARQLGTFGLAEILIFAAVVFVALLYLVSNGALSWGPAKRLQGDMGGRTTETTVTRITAGPPTDRAA